MMSGIKLAGPERFELSFIPSEGIVLPLDEGPICNKSWGGRNRTFTVKFKVSQPTVSRLPKRQMVDLERFELSPQRVRAVHATITPQVQKLVVSSGIAPKSLPSQGSALAVGLRDRNSLGVLAARRQGLRPWKEIEPRLPAFWWAWRDSHPHPSA